MKVLNPKDYKYLSEISNPRLWKKPVKWQKRAFSLDSFPSGPVKTCSRLLSHWTRLLQLSLMWSTNWNDFCYVMKTAMLAVHHYLQCFCDVTNEESENWNDFLRLASSSRSRLGQLYLILINTETQRCNCKLSLLRRRFKYWMKTNCLENDEICGIRKEGWN